MRVRPDLLVNPVSGESVSILQRPKQQGDSIEVLIEPADVGNGPGPHRHPNPTERLRVVSGLVEMTMGDSTVTAGGREPSTQLHTYVRPGDGFELALEDVFELFARGHIGPEGVVDRAAFDRRRPLPSRAKTLRGGQATAAP